MPRTPLLALTDIVDAIMRIERYTAGLTRTTFVEDDLHRDAVERCIEIISEASRRLPGELKAQHPSIPWQRSAAIGNVFRHEYDEVSPGLVWEVVSLHLPAPKQAVEQLMREASSGPSRSRS